ncbi:phosphatase PAP2 family protein [Cardinium endosymbiont of Oedothorax gibbosus]|uniref:phosphatase PAP2 family protein n=1 Tax=Cardinium endosymbiont of Oedothorax gibbosus TaxID=931101 RepID=UPI00202580DD|nr:phosphatase PAP2 family protein [Cardinium endosymbiont of Oedothorax gibbosus]
MLTPIKALDQALFFILNNVSHPSMDLLFKWITCTTFWIPLYLFLFFFIKTNLGWRGLLSLSLAILIADQSTSSLLKPFFARYRPCYAPNLPPIHLVGAHIGLYGFPSSHASNTFAFAIFFWKSLRKRYKYTYLFFPWATLISYGRIYGGMHYPLDVICGALLGIAIGLLSATILSGDR